MNKFFNLLLQIMKVIYVVIIITAEATILGFVFFFLMVFLLVKGLSRAIFFFCKKASTYSMELT